MTWENEDFTKRNCNATFSFQYIRNFYIKCAQIFLSATTVQARLPMCYEKFDSYMSYDEAVEWANAVNANLLQVRATFINMRARVGACMLHF